MPDPVHLSAAHRDTLASIFRHPTSHNIEWHDVQSLLEAVGSMKERHDGKFLVTIGDVTEIVERPRHKDIDTESVADLRRILSQAGYRPAREAGA
jgi:hypothetical protein